MPMTPDEIEGNILDIVAELAHEFQVLSVEDVETIRLYMTQQPMNENREALVEMELYGETRMVNKLLRRLPPKVRKDSLDAILSRVAKAHKTTLTPSMDKPGKINLKNDVPWWTPAVKRRRYARTVQELKSNLEASTGLKTHFLDTTVNPRVLLLTATNMPIVVLFFTMVGNHYEVTSMSGTPLPGVDYERIGRSSKT